MYENVIMKAIILHNHYTLIKKKRYKLEELEGCNGDGKLVAQTLSWNYCCD
jgi:hypothetical protein